MRYLQPPLDAATKHGPLILTNSLRRPWTSHGFQSSWGIAARKAGIVGVTFHVDEWMRRHTHRFPLGVDLIGANNAAGNKLDPGQWERSARDTALSLGHWTIGLAAAAILITGVLEIRRVRRLASSYVPAPPEVADTVGIVPPSLDDSTRG